MRTPDWVGQTYTDNATGNVWKANSITPGDWTLEVQNMQVKWSATSQKFGEQVGFFSFYDLPLSGVLTFESEISLSGFDIESLTQVTAIEFPNLVSIENSGFLSITFNPGLLTVSLPLWQSVQTNRVTVIQGNQLLSSLSLPQLVSAGVLNISFNPALVSFSAPVWIPTAGFGLGCNFSGNALNQASIDHILSRFVASPTWGNAGEALQLEGGTNSPPSSVGPGSNYDILTVRGAIVTVNP